MTNRSALQTLASRVLALALSECLPGVVIQEAGASMGGFFCDFSFSSPFSTEILTQLEERIRQIIRERRPVKVMEMVPFSASELLKKMGQLYRARQVLEQEDYVQIVQIGSFADWCEEPCSGDTGKAGVVRLIDKNSLGKGRFRIFGMAALSKDELNPRIKQFNKFAEWNHENRGLALGYWDVIDGARIWLAPGLDARRRLCDHWKSVFLPIAQEVEGDEGKLALLAKKRPRFSMMYFRRLEEHSFGMRGLMDSRNPLVMEVKSFDDPLKSCISFLQSVHKSLTILGLTFRIIFSGKKRKAGEIEAALEALDLKVDEWVSGDQPKLEFLISDNLQCEWVVAAVVGPWKKNGASLTVWVERNFALLLEKNEALLFF